MVRFTLEEKKHNIENFICSLKAQNRKLMSVSELVDVYRKEFEFGELSTHIRQVFDINASKYLEEQGVLYTHNERVEMCWDLLERLKKEFSDKSPVSTLDEVINIVELSEYEKRCILQVNDTNDNISDESHEERPFIDDYYNAGILRKLIKSDEDKNVILNKVIERMAGRSFLSMYNALVFFRAKCSEAISECFNNGEKLPDLEARYHIKMLMEGTDEESFLISHGFAFTNEEVDRVAEEQLQRLKELCPEPVANIRAFVTKKNIPIDPDELYSFYLFKWNLYERYRGEIRDQSVLFFIDEGLQKGTPSKYKKKLDESMKNANGKSAGTKGQNTFSIYSKLDKIDLLGFANDSGYGPDEKCFQKNVSAKVEVNGITFAIKTKFAKNKWLTNCNGIDGVKAIETMLSSSEVQERFFKNDPNARTNPDVVPEFSIRNIGSFPERAMFIRTVAAKILEPDVMSKLVEFAPKKKDGTLAKNRVTRIASSMIGIFPNYVVELAGRAKDDTTLVITLEEERVKPDSLEVSANDFINNNKELFGIDKYFKNE